VVTKDPGEFLPTSVQKSYFMLSGSARAVLDAALWKYCPGLSDLILIGGSAQLKPEYACDDPFEIGHFSWSMSGALN
jgi:hypothetical protein